MSDDIAFLRREIFHRLDASTFYETCRNIDMTEEEIFDQKLENLSKEEKYQLILRSAKKKMTPQEIYEVINNKAKWRSFMMSRQWDSDMVRFSGNKIRESSKERLLWELSRNENIDEPAILEEIFWMVTEEN